MGSLERLGLSEPIRAHIAAGRPYLGICLGYQLLFTESEEFGHAKGLDVLPGVVRRFPGGLKVPHMGWNQLAFGPSADLAILDGVPSGAYFYFVHSYYPEPRDVADCAVASCDYGVRFPALVAAAASTAPSSIPRRASGGGSGSSRTSPGWPASAPGARARDGHPRHRPPGGPVRPPGR